MVPVEHILSFAPPAAERGFNLDISQMYTAFDVPVTEGSWSSQWALHDSPLPFIGWSLPLNVDHIIPMQWKLRLNSDSVIPVQWALGAASRKLIAADVCIRLIETLG